MKKIFYIILGLAFLSACGTDSKKAEGNDAVLEENVEVDSSASDNTQVEDNK